MLLCIESLFIFFTLSVLIVLVKWIIHLILIIMFKLITNSEFFFLSNFRDFTLDKDFMLFPSSILLLPQNPNNLIKFLRYLADFIINELLYQIHLILPYRSFLLINAWTLLRIFRSLYRAFSFLPSMQSIPPFSLFI